jgi:alpha-ribazole phosphatase
MILHLIRHPQPLIDPGICYGQLDVAAENPVATAERLRVELLPGLSPGFTLWSSPLRRCRELSETLAELLTPLHLPVQFDVRLMEMNFGAWEGRPWDSVPRSELDAWAADVEGYAPPGGESPHQLRKRVLDFVAGLGDGEHVLVTHAGVIRLLLAHAAAASIADSLRHAPGYGSLTTLRLPAISP